MATKVFISWSGELSRSLGEALREWLPGALQHVKPYFTPDDIEKGTKWDSEIAKELESSDVGLICLTQDNTQKPWILFEAGALSKNFEKSKVCTILFNLDPADLKGPLSRFQHTRFSKEDFKKLVVAINASAGDLKLDAAVLDSVFEMWWPRLEEKVKNILAMVRENEVPGRRPRPEREIIEEILELSRMTAALSQGKPRENLDASESVLLEEIAAAIHGIPAEVAKHIDDESVPVRRRRSLRSRRQFIVNLMERAVKTGEPIAILLMVACTREDMPWLYEIGLDVYRSVKSGSIAKMEHELTRIRELHEFLDHNLFEEIAYGDKDIPTLSREVPQMLEYLLEKLIARRKE